MSSERNLQPPKLALRFLAWFCPPSLYESIEGDLLEQFEEDVKTVSEKKAKQRFIWNTIKFFKPEIFLRNKFSIELIQMIMITNYLKVMLRSLKKRKMHSAINVLGLSVGITFALVVGVFVWGELQVNQSLRDVDQLFLMESKYEKGTSGFAFFAPAPLIKEAKVQYPTVVESYYRFWDRGVTVSKADKHFRIQSMIGDSTFIDFFGLPVLYGDGHTALLQPNSIVITKGVALQFFNREDVVGETLALTTERNGIKDYQVTAVLDDPEPKNSVTDFMNMNAKIFLPLQNSSDFRLADPETWTDIICYAKLSPHVTTTEAEATINSLLKKNGPDGMADKRSISLSPLKDYYLITNHGAVNKLIISLTVVVVFILLLAIANFVNISIASSFSRLKEIGVRKVIGGIKRQVVFQFLTESVLLAVFAGVLAIVTYQLSRGFFSDLLATQLPSLLDFPFSFWALPVLGFVLIGLLAGIYPAFYLSSSQAIALLKGKFKSVKGTIQFSRALIATQFIIATFIFIATIVLSQQVSYFLEKDLGFDKSSVMIVTSVPRVWSDEGLDKMETVKSEFKKSPKVEGVALSWGAPGFNLSPVDARVYRPGGNVEDGLASTLTGADEDYASVFNLKLLEGQFHFESGNVRVPNTLVINEAAQKAMQLKVGDKVKVEFYPMREFTVSGIVKDFNFESLHEKIKPVVFIHNREFQSYRYFSFRLKPGGLQASVEEIERMWKAVFPNEPFEFSFSDEKLKDMYTTELQLKKASGVATVLVLVIVLAGVIGLISLTVAKRSKEIGIRKVHGASVLNILTLLSKEYAAIILVSFTIGVPSAWYFCSQWLNSFAYHIELGWWMFVAPVVIVFAITILIVLAQSFRAALANPVDSIKYE
jgi:putative ABC transport system permease protein